MKSEMYNSFSLIGNIAKVSEIMEQKNGTKFRYFTVAQNNEYKNKEGESVKDSSFINIKIYERYFKTFEDVLEVGRYIHVTGKLSFYRDGNNQEKILLIGNACKDLSKKNVDKNLEVYDYDWLSENEQEPNIEL